MNTYQQHALPGHPADGHRQRVVRLIDVAVVRRIGGLIDDAAEAADFHVQLGADDARPIY